MQQLVRFLAPRSESSATSIKRLIAKKILSVFIVTMALTSVPINPARELTTTKKGSLATTGPIRLGLSRRRGAFNKAICMLATAADENQRLAAYYEKVTSRVKGDSADGENSSGVEVIKVVHRGKPAPPSAWTPAQAASEALKPKSLISAEGTRMTDPYASPSYSVADHDYRNDQTDDPSGQQPEFIVGDMTFDTNPSIEQWVNYYSVTPQGRSTMRIGIERSNAYLEMARAEFRSAGVPEDLVWLACVESVWNPRAQSPAAAGGIWQFIPATATDYGLTVQSGNDERADPLKQTRVAATYLRDLYTIFGDWALAMAAYNSGEPRVMGAIVKNGNADFWELCDKGLLPKETRDYVPKILATIKLVGHADEYGLVSQGETAGPAGS